MLRATYSSRHSWPLLRVYLPPSRYQIKHCHIVFSNWSARAVPISLLIVLNFSVVSILHYAFRFSSNFHMVAKTFLYWWLCSVNSLYFRLQNLDFLKVFVYLHTQLLKLVSLVVKSDLWAIWFSFTKCLNYWRLSTPAVKKTRFDQFNWIQFEIAYCFLWALSIMFKRMWIF